VSVKPDYKSPALRKKKRAVRHQGLVVTLLAVVGLFGSLYGYVNKEKLLGDIMPAPSPPPQPEATKPAVAKPAPVAIPEAAKPKYDFYKLLPERQVVVPKGDITEHVPVTIPNTAPPAPDPRTAAKPAQPAESPPKAQHPTPAPQKPAAASNPAQPPAVAKAEPEPTPSSANRRYVIQAGSYSNAEQADRIKASLAMLGVQARIELVSAGGDRKLHRVRIGPFSDAKQAETMRQRLRNNNIQAITIKIGD